MDKQRFSSTTVICRYILKLTLFVAEYWENVKTQNGTYMRFPFSPVSKQVVFKVFSWSW